MTLKEQLKEEMREETKKLKEMSAQDKLWYIWEYYKFHIAGVLAAVLVVYIIATSIYNSTIHPGLYCMILNNQAARELDTSILEEDFHDLMGFGKKEPVYVESMFITYGDRATEYSYASMAKVSALVASRELDVITGDRENIDHYTALDGLADLRQLLPADILSAVEDRLLYAQDSTGQSVATSLDISQTEFARSLPLTDEAAGLAVINNSTHTDTAIALIRYIFDL